MILQIPAEPPKDLSVYKGYLAGFVYIPVCSIHYPYYNQSVKFSHAANTATTTYIYIYIHIGVRSEMHVLAP